VRYWPVVGVPADTRGLDMDTHIGDLHSTIVDRELEIVQELLDEILTHSEAIGDACDIFAELDCLLSLAEAARLYNYQRPDMIDENSMEIIQGRYVDLLDLIDFY